jgi:transposase
MALRRAFGVACRSCPGGRRRRPPAADEDHRQLNRDILSLTRERTEHINRIKGLLARLGLDVLVDEDFVNRLDGLRHRDGSVAPPELQRRLMREFERWQLANRQVHDLEKERARKIPDDDTFDVEKVRKQLDLGEISQNSARLFVMEFFAWRKIKNRRELGALAGQTPTPYPSGGDQREQGTSKAGNARLRTVETRSPGAVCVINPKASGASGTDDASRRETPDCVESVWWRWLARSW